MDDTKLKLSKLSISGGEIVGILGGKHREKKAMIHYLSGLYEMNPGFDKSKLMILEEPFSKGVLLQEPLTKQCNLKESSLEPDLLNEMKDKGKSIIISSYCYKDLEGICDRIIFLHNGNFIHVVNKYFFNPEESRHYTVGFHKKEDYDKFVLHCPYTLVSRNNCYKSVVLIIENNFYNILAKDLEKYDLRKVEFVPSTKTWYYSEEERKDVKH